VKEAKHTGEQPCLKYVGLDVSLKEVSICVMDEGGRVLARGSTPTDPTAIPAFVSEHAAHVVRIVHESGQLSTWLSRELLARGAPVICIDARLVHKALSARLNKSDSADAEGLAHLARTGWYRAVHIKEESSDQLRILIAAVKRFSPLKAWAVRLAARKGFKKANIATARKLAVIMHRIWRDGTTFIWAREGVSA